MGDSVLFWASVVLVVVYVGLITVLVLWIRRSPRRWGNVSVPKPTKHGNTLSSLDVEELAKALAEMAKHEHDPTMAASFQQASSALSPVFALSGYASTSSYAQRSATWDQDEPFKELPDAERAALGWLESQGAEAQVEVIDVLAHKVVELVTQQGWFTHNL